MEEDKISPKEEIKNAIKTLGGFVNDLIDEVLKLEAENTDLKDEIKHWQVSWDILTKENAEQKQTIKKQQELGKYAKVASGVVGNFGWDVVEIKNKDGIKMLSKILVEKGYIKDFASWGKIIEIYIKEIGRDNNGIRR